MIGSTAATQPETAAEEREALLRSTREEEIRNLAYEIYRKPPMNTGIGARIG
jgi:hypothetical protein